MRVSWLQAVWVALTVVAATAAPDVTLTERGDEVTLANGLLSATLSKSKASVSALKFRGFDMLSSGYYSMDGGANYRNPSGCRFAVKTATPDLVDVGMRRVWRNEPQAFDIEMHYVLRRGDTGLYCYALLDHPATYPATGYGEWRFVWKLSNDLLERIYVDERRHWQMQNSRDKGETMGIKEITKLLSGVRAGQYDCKYEYAGSYHELGCWGHASDVNKVGAWMVLGGCDYFNDGPTKQDLNAAAGINHLHFGMNHYGGSNPHLAAGQAWRKFYGPFYLYCNYNEAGADACWADAKARVKVEQQSWPYAWLTDNADYPPAAQRGGVTGRLLVRDTLKPAVTGAGAWVGLARPPADGNWQSESYNYQYWAKADLDGQFTIPHVRPGNYTLFAFTRGAVGEFARADVRVTAGAPLRLGDVVWQVPHKGRTLAWELGVPDRSAAEFLHGDDYFLPYLFQRLEKELPNPLEYTVGKSDWTKDWNYAQSRHVRADGQVEPMRWRVRFNLPAVPAGDATLTLALASADRARLDLTLNGDQPFTSVTPAVQGGNALLREGIHAKYGVEYVTVPARLLRAGENVLGLSLANVSGPGNHVMYDYLSLELP